MNANVPQSAIYPPQFASRLTVGWSELDESAPPLPSLDELTQILDVAYQSSFLREEDEPIRCRLILAEPCDWKEGEAPPEGFHVLTFAEPIPFSPHEIRKLSGAASYYRSLIGIRIHPENGLQIWGIIESGTRWLNRVEGGRFDGTPLPPHFVVHILGSGRILTACGYRRHLELDAGFILATGFDPFKSKWLPNHFAPVRQWLLRQLADRKLEGAVVEDCFIRTMAQNVVRRTLSLVRTRGHGGMLVYLPLRIVKSPELSSTLRLRCPFAVNGSAQHFPELMLRAMHRLSTIGSQHGFERVTWTDYQSIHDPLLTEVDESFSEMAHLLADLMCVDGALVLSTRFQLIGFGGEILGNQPVEQVDRALDLEADSVAPERADSSGTRHRSAYRLLSAVPDALAIVVSQDGSIRFVSNRAQRVIYWPYLP